MTVTAAVEDVLLGATLLQVAREYRDKLIEDFRFREDEVTKDTFAEETGKFMRQVARHIGDRHAGDPRVLPALHAWVLLVDHYEAWDALLAGFDFPGKAALVRRGKMRFPGPLTAHWQEGAV